MWSRDIDLQNNFCIKIRDIDLKVSLVGHAGTAWNFRPISNNMQSINRIHQYVQETKVYKNFNQKFEQLSDANADTDAGMSAIALPVLSYRRAKNWGIQLYKGIQIFLLFDTKHRFWF